ncbi:hypothetical protein RB601_009776 [Gaeumannomyces tritici]
MAATYGLTPNGQGPQYATVRLSVVYRQGPQRVTHIAAMAFALEQLFLFSVDGGDFVAWKEQNDARVMMDGRWLVTVLPCCSDPVDSTMGGAQSLLDRFLNHAVRTDDVFCSEFLSGIIVPIRNSCDEDRQPKNLRVKGKDAWLRTIVVEDGIAPAPGPYVLDAGRLSPVYRLYEDTSAAFSVPLRTSPDNELVATRIAPRGHHPRCVAVPSRMRSFGAAPGPPLEGVRVAVKDIFDIKGHRTSLGSREYLKLSPPANHTAPAIQCIIDASGVVVGLTHMCSMVLSQHPTQCIDFPAPFNPRGDGYQSPSGGSSGQAAAIASYDWLDVAIGSDSTASARLPALANGCFSFRPSGSMVSCQGMWSGVPQTDTPCLFARSLEVLSQVVNVWCPGTIRDGEPLKPTRLLSLPKPPIPEGSPQHMLFTSFREDLEKFAGIESNLLSVEDMWSSSPPPEAGGAPLEQYLSPDVSTWTYVSTFWGSTKVFWEGYQQAFGRQPYMPPPLGIHTWDKARDCSSEQRKEGAVRFEVYRQWLLRTVLQAEAHDTVLIWPIAIVEPVYRDEWPRPPTGDQLLWEPLLLAPVSGAPELVIPVGEVPYVSRVSGKEEVLPVCISMLGPPGTDTQLIAFAAKFLEGSGRYTAVKTGRSIGFASGRHQENHTQM